MKNFTTNLQEQLNRPFGSEPLFEVEVNGVYYSTQEWTFADSDKVYGYINSFSGVEDFNNGFGTEQMITVVFTDLFGHFKLGYDTTIDFSSLTAVVYLYAYGLTLKDDLFEVMRGKVNNPTWSEDGLSFEIQIINNFEQDEILYTPALDDIPSEETSILAGLVEEPWPSVYGSVKNMPLRRLTTGFEMTLDEDTELAWGDSPGSTLGLLVKDIKGFVDGTYGISFHTDEGTISTKGVLADNILTIKDYLNDAILLAPIGPATYSTIDTSADGLTMGAHKLDQQIISYHARTGKGIYSFSSNNQRQLAGTLFEIVSSADGSTHSSMVRQTIGTDFWADANLAVPDNLISVSI